MTMKNRLNIALLAGGDSSERVISLRSAAQVAAALDRTKYDVYLIDINGTDWGYAAPDGERVQVDRNDFSLTLGGGKIMLDYALILIHGTPGEDGKLQGYLEIMRVPYSSCGMVSTVATFDKRICKRMVEAAGIPTANEVFIRKGEVVDPDVLVARLGLPMFIKPNASGSSFGVTKVADRDAIPAAVEAAMEESDTVLAEEFLAGREIACGLMLTHRRDYTFPLTEIISKNEFFDYEAKYTPGRSDEITPADLDEATAETIRSMARTAYRACDCRGIVRVDFMVRPDGSPAMIEINSVPGMSAGSIVPQQAASAGLSLGELFELVISETWTGIKR